MPDGMHIKDGWYSTMDGVAGYSIVCLGWPRVRLSGSDRSASRIMSDAGRHGTLGHQAKLREL